MDPKATILLSRQPLRPCAGCEWVRRSVAAVHWLKQHGYTLCTSVGMQTWELLTAVGSLHGLNLEIYIPSGPDDDFAARCADYRYQFNLSEALVRFVQVPIESGEEKSVAPVLRDEAICATVDAMVPVSVSPHGNMARMLDAQGRGKKVLSYFRTGPPVRQSALSYNPADDPVNPDLEQLNGRYLFHWTRTTNGPWPQERAIDYYRDVIRSEQFPRSARDTLMRIGKSRRILGTPRHMPENTSTVSFSGLDPLEVVPLMRWRARYHEMSFEPYAIGVRVDLAERLKILPVAYYTPEEKSLVVSLPSWQTQSRGSKSDWTAEKEYRRRGNMDLDYVPTGSLRLICRYPDEAKGLEQQTGITTIPMFHRPTT